MKNRWFHSPELHHPDPHHERKVAWLELFYDLIFVATIIQLGDALSSHVSAGGFAAFCALFAPVWLLWTGLTFYNNRFVVDDMLHRGMTFLQMFAIGTMAVTVGSVLEGEPQLFAAAYASARLLLVGLYARTWRQTPEARELARLYIIIFLADAALWFVSTAFSGPVVYVLWGAGVALNLWLPISTRRTELIARFPADTMHMAERYGLLVIIVLGESFVKILTHVSHTVHTTHHLEPSLALMSAMTLLITCCVWWIYFDDVAGSRLKPSRFASAVWVYAHLPMTMAITAVGVATKKVVDFELWAPPPAKYMWLLSGSLAMVFFFVGVIDSVTLRRQAELSDRARVNMRVASSAFILVMAAASGHLSGLPVVGFVALICVAQVVFDLMAAPDAMDAEEQMEADHAVASTRPRRARDGDGGPVRRDVSEAVRRGAPSELRRDIYFFLVEGSWSRLFATLAFLYLFSNLFFAGLYVLRPGSVAGVDTFADAFFFSVQTMSTIGYGALAPATGYGDVLVTIEAAFGLAGVALATGIMFAKVSRPSEGVLFAAPMVVSRRGGVDTLMFRMGNARGNDVVDATVTVTAMIDEQTPEGHTTRALHTLALRRNQSPMFALTWTVMHTLDASSPLFGMDLSDDASLIGIVVTMTGHDGTYGQTTYARHTYYPEDIRVGHRYQDVLSELPDGRMQVDFSRFHGTTEDELAGR